MTHFRKVLCIALCLITGIISANAEVGKYVYVFYQGKVIFKEQASLVSSPEWKAGTLVTLYGSKIKIPVFQGVADSVTYSYTRPVADVLDIQFNADGTVTDASPMHNNVSVTSPADNSKVPVYYSDTYKSYVGQFWNNYGGGLGDQPVYCRVDYADNVDFLAALKGGHTLECLFRLNYPEEGMSNVEIKPMSSHQAGGTGLMICTKARGLNGANELTFLPNVSQGGSTSSWKWGVSGVVPEDSVYYHVVGVWDKEQKKAMIYVNGELKNTIDADGELHLNASSAYHWFGIGCDAANGTGEQGARFDIVNARIYGRALGQTDVDCLWNEMAGLTQKDTVVTPSFDIEPEPIDTTVVTSNLILDVQFNADGTAYDASPSQLDVTTVNTGGVTTYYNNTYKRYVASFSNPWGGTPTGYYKADYDKKQAFKDALADGHTLECLIMPNFSSLGSVEVKPFASHQAGGTGFLVCYPGEGGTSANEFTFLPNVSTTGSSKWNWVTSGVTPESNKYYHLVGVWNKETGMADVYVNGELKNSMVVDGDFNFATSGSRWFGIGGDASPSGSTNGWSGDIVTARVYDNPMTQTDVDSLWAIVKELQENEVPPLVTNFSYISGLTVKEESKFPIKGEGFAEGDCITATTTTEEPVTYTIPATITEDGVLFEIPIGFPSGTCRLGVVRGEQVQDLGVCVFKVSNVLPKGAQVIAHRGYWTKGSGTAQNSRESLYNAIEGEFYGSETDVWITADDKVVVNHNSTINSVSIQNSPYSDIRDAKLSNGETLPTLEDFLDIMDGAISETKLIIEIKTHANLKRLQACCEATVNAVKSHGLEDRVEYIAYSLSACQRLVQLAPGAMVQYLNGDKEPSDLAADGIMGLDYKKTELIQNDRIAKAHDLNMVTNAYTIDATSEMAECNNLGIDFITTNYPEQAQAIYEYYRDNQPEPVESEAYLTLKAYTEQCVADSLVAEQYTDESFKVYTDALANALGAVELNQSTDETYTTLYNDLKSAREGLVIIKMGDVNRDGRINATDVVSVYNYIINGEGSGITTERADVNGDNKVNATDVVTIYNIIVNGSGQ